MNRPWPAWCNRKQGPALIARDRPRLATDAMDRDCAGRDNDTVNHFSSHLHFIFWWCFNATALPYLFESSTQSMPAIPTVHVHIYMYIVNRFGHLRLLDQCFIAFWWMYRRYAADTEQLENWISSATPAFEWNYFLISVKCRFVVRNNYRAWWRAKRKAEKLSTTRYNVVAVRSRCEKDDVTCTSQAVTSPKAVRRHSWFSVDVKVILIIVGGDFCEHSWMWGCSIYLGKQLAYFLRQLTCLTSTCAIWKTKCSSSELQSW